MDLELSGKIAVVTGASVGIGREITRVLAAEGAQTVVIARRGNLLAALQQEIEKTGGKAPLAIEADLYESSAPRQIRDTVLKNFDYIDILVNNAGRGAVFRGSSFDHLGYADETAGGTKQSPEALVEDAWEKSFAINLTAVRRMTHAFLPVMQKRNWGRIINITGSMEPKAENAVNAAKAGVHAWAKGLSREIGKYGITINCLAPGRIHSEQIHKRLYPTPESEQQFAAANIPLGVFGEPYDMAYMAAFLCSPKARYITGQRMYIDGGLHRAL